jgi:hypothetical protein
MCNAVKGHGHLVQRFIRYRANANDKNGPKKEANCKLFHANQNRRKRSVCDERVAHQPADEVDNQQGGNKDKKAIPKQHPCGRHVQPREEKSP